MLDTAGGLFRLYGMNVKLGVSRAMAYRFDFVTGLITSILFSGTAPFLQYIFFTQTKGYPGWDLRQIMLFQGLLLFWLGLKELLFGDVRFLAESLVRKGDFDRLLVKPYPPLGVLLCSGFNLKGIGATLSGCALAGYAMVELRLVPDALQIALFLLMLAGSVVLYMAITTILCTIIIMLVQVGRIGELADRILGFGDYPVNIYPKLMRQAFLTIFPFAIWAYVPAQILLDRVDASAYYALAGCVAVFLFSLWLWNRSLRKYTSAGG